MSSTANLETVYQRQSSARQQVTRAGLPIILLMLDLDQQIVERRHLQYAEQCLASMIGCDVLDNSGWVTQSDLYCDFFDRTAVTQTLDARLFESRYRHERFHDLTFDLYLHNMKSPSVRLVNVAVPKWMRGEGS